MADQETDKSDDFVAQSTGERTGLVTEFVDFLKDNKKWWLAPIIIILLLIGLLIVVAGGPAGAFIYPFI